MDLQEDLSFGYTDKSMKWSDVYKTYESIRGLCDCINEAFKSLVTLYLANCMVAQATMMDALLYVPDVLTKIRLVFIIVSSMLTFILAADVNDKVKFCWC